MATKLDFQIVDILHTQGTLVVQWRGAPRVPRHAVEHAIRESVARQLAQIVDLERKRPSKALAAAQEQLGQTLYQLLDGPKGALRKRLEAARRNGRPLHLVVRLRSEGGEALTQHPAFGWRLHLLKAAGPEGYLTLEEHITVTVQLGEAAPTQTEKVRDDSLNVLFMASAPRGVKPELDYDAEEERILSAVAPLAHERPFVMQVVEDGSLAELGLRLKERPYHVVHLSGHGIRTRKGLRLLMEDKDGERDDISPKKLVKAFRDGVALPRVVFLSSCHGAAQQGDLPSLAAALLQAGVPCVIGWNRPVSDEDAMVAAEALYGQLTHGAVAAQAVASARRKLHEVDRGRPTPRYAWSTLEMLTTSPAGFTLVGRKGGKKRREPPPPPEQLYEWLGHRRLRVLKRGFIGRRRELQVLGRVLRRGRHTKTDGSQRRVAGAVVHGMKGQGKSCLAGRALGRYVQDVGESAVVVLHGELENMGTVLEAFREEAVRNNDPVAEALLKDRDSEPLERLQHLLMRHWRKRPMAIVLDDFEQNLNVPGKGAARLKRFASKLLEVLVPACLEGRSKLLVTTTARFTLPVRWREAFVWVALGPMEEASIEKLRLRGLHYERELDHIEPRDWRALCARLGRNARVLDWARQLLVGKTPDEVREVVARAGLKPPTWKAWKVPGKAKQDQLAALFLKHMALEEARAKVGRDALKFIERARVYELPVPAEAFEGLTEGLALSLEGHVVALANLGLLEAGTEGRQVVYRVSPLVKEKFKAAHGKKWHSVAAEYWRKATDHGESWYIPALFQAWEHALQAKRQDIADELADIFKPLLFDRGEDAKSASMSKRHIAVFPRSIAGLDWAGTALYRAGKLREGQTLLEKGVKLAEQQTSLQTHAYPNTKHKLSICLFSLADVLKSQGNLPEARSLLERCLEIQKQVFGTDVHLDVASSLQTLSWILRVQGDLPAARSLLERCLEIVKQIHGTELHPNVAAPLDALAGVLGDQGDLSGARSLLERSLEIKRRVRGTEFHLSIAASLYELAGVLKAQGDLSGARSLLERSLEIERRVRGTELHTSIAASLYALAGVLRAQGNLSDARFLLELSLDIQKQVRGTEIHFDLANSLRALAVVLRDQGDLTAARSHLERSIEIEKQVFGTEVATSLYTLAMVLRAQGDLPAARSHLERSIEIAEQALGTKAHLSIAASLHQLAGVLKEQGDLPAARLIIERAIDIYRQVLRTEVHPSVAILFHELAVVLRAEGELPAARIFLERSLEIYKQVLDTEVHSDVAASLHALAIVLRDQGDLAAARLHLEHAITIDRQVLGTEVHPDIATAYASLGGLQYDLGNLDEGEAAIRRALDLLECIYCTRDCEIYAVTEFSLAILLLRRERMAEAIHLLLHVRAVLQDKAPHHPLLGHPVFALLRGLFPSPAASPQEFVRLALTARASGLPPPIELREGLQAMRTSGDPFPVVADFLEQISTGGPLPAIPDGLPENVAALLASVCEAAEKLSSPS